MGGDNSVPQNFAFGSYNGPANKSEAFDPLYMSQWYFVRADAPSSSGSGGARKAGVSARVWSTEDLATAQLQFTENSWRQYQDRMPRTKAEVPALRFSNAPKLDTAGKPVPPNLKDCPQNALYELVLGPKASPGTSGSLRCFRPASVPAAAPAAATASDGATASVSATKPAAAATAEDVGTPTPAHRLRLALCGEADSSTERDSKGFVWAYKWTRGKAAHTLQLTHADGVTYHFSTADPTAQPPALEAVG